ncbi:MAG TPA: MBL fold metallo-hydrolase [bacterium]|nr:MBL fold metallo-hydrolase [bacterium]
MQIPISIRILGDSGPFSPTGRSISYLIELNDYKLLIDAGAPVFYLLSFPEICSIDAVLITHLHEDHKRWLSDLLLFRKYVTPTKPKIKLLSSESIHNEIKQNLIPSLEKTLSADSKKIIRLNYDDFVDCIYLGPRAKYKVICENNNYQIIDENEKPVSIDKAKIFKLPFTENIDILVYDERDKVWVNPEAYYSFSDERYYYNNRTFDIPEINTKIEIINAPIWHGISAVGAVLTVDDTKIFFSGDTVFDLNLWKELAVVNNDNAILKNSEIKNKFVISDDINKYIEKMWSMERYKEAIMYYNNTDFIIHDSAAINSIVHTDFKELYCLEKSKTLLTHSPDNYVSYIPLTYKDKKYIIQNKKIFENSNNKNYELNADIYVKYQLRYFVGYKNSNGLFAVIENDNGLLELKKRTEINQSSKDVEYYNLFEDIDGAYYPADSELNNIYIKMKNKIYKSVEKENGEILLILQQNHRE